MKKIAVIGSGLSGLWLSKCLSEQGHEVVLLESRDVAGGRYRRARETSPYEAADLSFLPGDDLHEKFGQILNQLHPGLFQLEVAAHQSLTYLHGEWRDFVGFGDDPAGSVSTLSRWNVGQELFLNPAPEKLVESILTNPSFEIRLRTEVTHFEVEGEKVREAVLNGSTTLTADEFIFTPSPVRLLELFSHEALKSATRSRLARLSGWTAVFLRLAHGEIPNEGKNLRFLLGTGKEFEPTVGRIFPTHSIWMSLIPAEKSLEPDYVTGQIKGIKRVLKRHAPELLEKTTHEHIFIQNEAYGELDLKLKNPPRMNEVSNFWLANHRLSALLGGMAELHAAEEVLNHVFVAEAHNLMLTDQQL